MKTFIHGSLAVAGGVGLMLLATLVTLTGGCAGRPELIPNSDPSLRKTSAQFSADAAKRFPYKSDAPRGGNAPARAQIGYWADRIDIVNTSDTDWGDTEIWVNRAYVVTLPKIEHGKLKSIPFQAIFNDKGVSFPTDNSKTHVEKLEVFHDGKMFDVPTQLAD